MKSVHQSLAFCALLLFAMPVAAQNFTPKTASPEMKKLDFLIGTWRFTGEFYDKHGKARGKFTIDDIRRCVI